MIPDLSHTPASDAARLLDAAAQVAAWEPPALAGGQLKPPRAVPSGEPPAGSAASLLVRLALGAGTVSHNAAGTPYLRVVIQRTPCYLRLPGSAARAWLAARFYLTTAQTAPRRALDTAMLTLAGLGISAARLPGPEATAAARLSRR